VLGSTLLIPETRTSSYKPGAMYYAAQSKLGQNFADVNNTVASTEQTRQHICEMFGYDTVSSYSNYENYTSGRQNYTSPKNNNHIAWNGSAWVRVGASTSQWLTSLTCGCSK
jgi:hypothetical protein